MQKNFQMKNILTKLDHYLSKMINDHKTQGEWKIQLTVAINFTFSKDSEESLTMHTNWKLKFMSVIKLKLCG